MPLDWNHLKYGHSIHDMHDGLPALWDKLEKLGVTSYPHHSFPIRGGSRLIADMIRTRGDDEPDRTSGLAYTNKLLVLVGREEGRDGELLTFAYSYDDRRLGFVVLSRPLK